MDFNFTLETKNFPCLKDYELHIWSTCLPYNEKYISYFKTILSEDEQQKANRFRFFKDQEYFIISRGILRSLLGKYLACPPKDIEISYGPWGKPYVLKTHRLYFNISHSKNYVLYAVTRNCEIGIDLEYMNPDFDIDTSIFNMLSFKEASYLKSVDIKNKVRAFFKCWVCREAFLKASGKGLHRDILIPFDSFDSSEKVVCCNEIDKKMIFPHYFEVIPNYASAFFIEGPYLRPVYYTWNLS